MLKTRPNTGTYYPPKVMLDGQWRYMVGVTEWHDHEHDAREAHRLSARVAELEHTLTHTESMARAFGWDGTCPLWHFLESLGNSGMVAVKDRNRFMEALEEIADTDPDDLQAFHDIANGALNP